MRDRIVRLRELSVLSNNRALVSLCDLALDGNSVAWDRCVDLMSLWCPKAHDGQDTQAISPVDQRTPCAER